MFIHVNIKITKLYFTPGKIIVISCIFTHLSFFWADFLLWHTYMIARATVVIESGIVIPRIISNVDQSKASHNLLYFM